MEYTKEQKATIAVGRLIRILSQYGIYVFIPLADGGPVDLIAMEDNKLYKFQCKYRNDSSFFSNVRYSPNAFDFIWATFNTGHHQRSLSDIMVPYSAVCSGFSDGKLRTLGVDGKLWSKFMIQNLPQPFKLAKVYSMERP